MGRGKRSGKGSGKPGKKKLYILVTGILLIIVVVAFALYYVGSKTNVLKISKFENARSIVADQVLYKFSVMIENQGINDVSGLVLKVRVLGDGVELGGDSFNLPTLLRGQKYEPDEVTVWINVTNVAGKTISFSAKLELNNRTLDEATSS